MLLFGDSYLDALDEANDGGKEQNLLYSSQNLLTSKYPQLRIHRLSEEKKFVPIELDIEIHERLIIQQRFYWNLNDQHISPSDFVSKFCQSLNLNESTTAQITSQFLFQLTDYIVTNTHLSRAKMKKAEEKNKKVFEEDVKPNQTDFSMPSATPDKMDSIIEDKQTARQRQLEEQKKLNSYSVPISSKSNYFKDKKTCQYCAYKNISPIQYCKQCSIPFYISDKIKKDTPRVKVSLKFFERIMNKFPILFDEVVKNRLPLQWFESTYFFQQKFQEQLKSSEYLDAFQLDEIEAVIDSYFEIVAKGQEIPEDLAGKQQDESKSEAQDQVNNNEMDEEEENTSSEIENSHNNPNLKPSSSVGKRSKEKSQTNPQLQHIHQNSSESGGQDSQNSENSSNSENESEGEQNGSSMIQKQIKKRGRPPKKPKRGRKRIK